MLVVVVAVGGVPVPVVHVIDVAIVRYHLVTAVRPVLMLVLGMGQVRQRMLVIVPLVRRVGVALMHVVDVSLALHARVPAIRSVFVAVVPVAVVGLVIRSRHCSSLSSLLCCTASATM